VSRLASIVVGLLLLGILASPAEAVIEIGGLLTTDTTWTNQDTILVTSTVVVADSVELTIQPGTVILFNDIMSLNCTGQLQARGTESAPIVFTSSADTAGGSPEVGSWSGVNITVGGFGSLSYCTVRNATNAVRAYDAEVEIANCLIENFSLRGVDLYGIAGTAAARGTVRRSIIRQTAPDRQGTGIGIYAYRGSQLTAIQTRIYHCGTGMDIYAVSSLEPSYEVVSCDLQHHSLRAFYVHAGG